ncbi:hypothetical protein SAMN04488063_2795 [Halopelagius inordinatus]|uniref:DUF7982 domain-containing protein n=1 Tax=Halopelagius inordinatus TaxID=553467 RepID=A0A1I2U6C2_9EURY|nr:hypothetical protein [Halopelagius inordinatus]SFG72563.1 hypothetical protein SAMN04488063_2795 [Halopelagius inordinatus]
MSLTDERATEPPADGRSESNDDNGSRPDDPATGDERERRLEELRAENERLREDYARGKRLQHRQTAIALLGVGLVGIAAGITFPSARTVLLALGSTGVFGSILTYFLSPDTVMPATVGRSAYDAVRETGSTIRDELGLADVAVYVPVDSVATETRAPVRLFVPQSPEYDLPSDDDLRSAFVVPEDGRRRGVAFTPTAGRMLAEFERTRSAQADLRLDTRVAQLCDALVEQFELLRAADAELDEEMQRITVGVTGVSYPNTTGFDHPVASFLGGGLACGLETPVTVEVERVDDGESDVLITCRW